MNVNEAIILFRYYQQSHHRKERLTIQTLLGTFETEKPMETVR